MAKQDIRPLHSQLWKAVPYRTKAGNTAIKAGEMVIKGTSGDVKYVTAPANGASNTAVWVGQAVSNDTNSASVDGIVYVIDDADAEFVARPTTSANLSNGTAVRNSLVTLDIIGGVQTIDEDDTTNGALFIRDWDVNRNEVYFSIKKSVEIKA